MTGLLLWSFVSGGDLFDRFHVISSSASPDGQKVAVLYRYDYAELSMRGFSVWVQAADQLIEDSRSGWPNGEAAFTMVNMEESLKFSWTPEGVIEILASQPLTVRWTGRAKSCFWTIMKPRSEAENRVLCLITEGVLVKME